MPPAVKSRAPRTLDHQSVGTAYAKMSSYYDLVFERVFDSGRKKLFDSLDPRRPLRILEIGVGTGLSFPYYAPAWRVVGIDYSPAMLAKAVERLRKAPPSAQVELLQMDAGRLAFPDDSFDVCLAAYVISAMPEPEKALAEMKRVTRPGGRIMLLNHFLTENPLVAWVERKISPWCVPMGFRTDLAMRPLLASARLRPDSVRKVNAFRLWRLVDCHVNGD